MTVLNNEDPADPSVHEPVETVPWPEVTRYSGGASHEGIGGRVWIRLSDDGPEVEYVPAMPARVALTDEQIDQAAHALKELRAELEAAREKQRMLTDHAVRVDTEAFKGNIDALSKLDLDAMDAQPLLLAVQNWDISTGRARELLRCWVLGTFKPDMLPECGDDLFEEAEEPRTAWRTLRAEADALRAALQPFADTDLTNPLVRDTFGFDVLRARAALQEQKP